MILDIFEDTTGGRLIQNYNVIGGVQADLHPDFVRKTKEFIVHLRVSSMNTTTSLRRVSLPAPV